MVLIRNHFSRGIGYQRRKLSHVDLWSNKTMERGPKDCPKGVSGVSVPWDNDQLRETERRRTKSSDLKPITSLFSVFESDDDDQWYQTVAKTRWWVWNTNCKVSSYSINSVQGIRGRGETRQVSDWMNCVILNGSCKIQTTKRGAEIQCKRQDSNEGINNYTTLIIRRVIEERKRKSSSDSNSLPSGSRTLHCHWSSTAAIRLTLLLQ